MLINEPTAEEITEWKRIFEANHSIMKPNRKNGNEVIRYFKEKYPYQFLDNAKFQEVVAQNILMNEISRSKLPNGVLPNIQSYQIDDVLIGIDLISGEFHMECENMEKCVPIYDDLFVYRGLDEEDLKNFFLVAEYVRLTQS